MISDSIFKGFNKTRLTKDAIIICHAPFVSMNFEQTGNATACCYNRSHVLGTYPAVSLHDMWFGAEADKLRKYIESRDLGGGCEVCSKQLESKNFYGTHARHFDVYAEALPEIKQSFFDKLLSKPLPQQPREIKYPKVLEFELSNTCNLECIMCNGYFSSSIRKNREGLPLNPNPYDDEFVNQLREFIPHLTDAKFLGGEPFQIDIYYKIWELIQELNPEVTIHITTNATVLSGRAKGLLEKLKCGIVVSIDSIVKETYERIRVNARHERVMENVEYFKNYTREKNTWMSFAVCPMTVNWQEMPALVEYCNANNIFVFFNTVFKPEEYTLRFLPAKLLESIIKYYQQFKFTHSNYTQFQNNNSFKDLINQLKNWHTDAVNRERIQLKIVKSLDNKLSSTATTALSFESADEKRVFDYLLEFLKLKTEILHSPTSGKAFIEDKMKAIITKKEDLVINLAKVRAETGYKPFLDLFINAVYKLHLLLAGTNADEAFKTKGEGLKNVIWKHQRNELIINEIVCLEPLYVICVLRDFTLENIEFQINNSY